MWYSLILIWTISSYVDPVFSADQSPRLDYDDDTEPWKYPVLRKFVVPEEYDLYISPRYQRNGTDFYGNVTIKIYIFKETKNIVVHAKQLTLTDWRVLDMDGTEIGVEKHFDWPKHDYHVMQTREFLTKGYVKLRYNFNGKMSLEAGSVNKTSGLYNIPYMKENGKWSWLVVSDTGLNDARYIFPNFDEPRFKARFTLKIQHWIDFTALSNMPLKEYVDVGDTVKTSVFEQSPPMSSHQLSFAVTDFTSKNKTVDGKQLFVWGRPDQLENARYSLDATPIILDYLRQELDEPYPLDKLDQLAVPGDDARSIGDDWGLNIFSESGLLFDDMIGEDAARFAALKGIAHSLAHSYFGNLVTVGYWEEVWLSEALATFYEIRAVTAVDSMFMHEYAYGEQIEEAMYSDAINALYSLRRVSRTAESQNPRFICQEGVKGAAIIRMLESVVGEDSLRRGVRRFLDEHKYTGVWASVLWNATREEMENKMSTDVRENINDWLDAKGFPLITIKLLPGNVIQITQTRFLDDPLLHPDREQTWRVPLTYRIKGGTQKLTWLAHKESDFEIPELKEDDWIEFNVDRTGYYRVNYDDGLWNLLAMQLYDDHTVFTVLSRTKLLSDARALVSAGKLGYEVFLTLTKYASKETSLTPWLHMYRGLTEINMIYNTTLVDPYKNYVLSLTRPLMDKLQVKDEGTYEEKQLRPLIMQMACSAGHEGCVANTTGMFQAWIRSDTENPVPTKLRLQVYCIGVALSEDETEWNTVYERYTALPETEAYEKQVLLSALCCTRKTNLLERLLDFSVSSAVDDGVRQYIMRNVATNPYTERYEWNWLKRNYVKVNNSEELNNSDQVAATALEQVVSRFNTRMQYQEVLDFYKDYPEIHPVTQGFINDIIEKNIQWVNRNAGVIMTWLEANARS